MKFLFLAGYALKGGGVVPVRPVKRLRRQQGLKKTWTISAFTNSGRSRCSPALHTHKELRSNTHRDGGTLPFTVNYRGGDGVGRLGFSSRSARKND